MWGSATVGNHFFLWSNIMTIMWINTTKGYVLGHTFTLTNISCNIFIIIATKYIIDYNIIVRSWVCIVNIVNYHGSIYKVSGFIIELNRTKKTQLTTNNSSFWWLYWLLLLFQIIVDGSSLLCIWLNIFPVCSHDRSKCSLSGPFACNFICCCLISGFFLFIQLSCSLVILFFRFIILSNTVCRIQMKFIIIWIVFDKDTMWLEMSTRSLMIVLIVGFGITAY